MVDPALRGAEKCGWGGRRLMEVVEIADGNHFLQVAVLF
jgi:hypothetical protein